MSKKMDAIDVLAALAEGAKAEKKNGRYKPTLKQQKAVIDFAIANKCVIHPLGMSYYIEGFNEFKHCVCDKNRPTCPCPEAPAEIAEKGHCLCQLFWRSFEDYIKAKRLDALCPKGGDHEWGIDGLHQNSFCKKCFANKPEGEV